MFTGIVEITARVRSVDDESLWMDVIFVEELKLGQSVSCSGVCLTVVELDEQGFKVEVMQETKDKTYFADLKVGDLVNVERAMSAQGRFDGHIVQGHVDGVGELLSVENIDEASRLMTIKIPKSLNKYIVQKGSITIDGVSLTVMEIAEDRIKIGIIPHTWKETNFLQKKLGDKFNVEVDVLAKYIEKLAVRS